MRNIITHTTGWSKISPMSPFHRKKTKYILINALFIFSLILAGCGKKEAQADIPSYDPTPTALPIATMSPDRVVLVRKPNSDPTISSQAEILLRELAGGSGLEFEIREDMINNEVSPDMKIVVFLEKPENLGSLAAGAPSTQFVAITNEDWNPAPNVTIIRQREEHTAFMAGYLAAMLAPNFRVGALLAAEKIQFNQAFINGVYYYCGLCAAQIYPLNTYPKTATQPAGSPATNWQTAFSEVNTSKINVLYVANEAASAELYSYLSTVDVALLGSQSPTEEGRSRWVATLYSDGISPIRDIWNDLLAGNGGKSLNAALNITDNMFISVQDGLVWLSEGKFNFALKTMELLRNDQIYPLSVN